MTTEAPSRFLATYPELQTRQEAIRFLEANPRLRSRYFRHLNLLEQIVTLEDLHGRQSLFSLYEHRAKLDLVERLEAYDTSDRHAYNQLFSAWNNIVHNMRAGVLRRENKPLVGPHDVHVRRLGPARPISKEQRRAWAHAKCGSVGTGVCVHGSKDCPQLLVEGIARIFDRPEERLRQGPHGPKGSIH